MPSSGLKWDSDIERDLCIAIIQSNNSEGRVRCDWSRVTDIMNKLGHGFTKQAINQHFSKSILKDFKIRHGEEGTSAPASATATPKKGTPKKAAAPKGSAKKATPTSAKRSKPDKSSYLGPDGDSEAAEAIETPVKRFKKEHECESVEEDLVQAIKDEDTESGHQQRFSSSNENGGQLPYSSLFG